MKNYKLEKMNLNYVHEELENGLTIFVVPMPFKKKYVTFTTKYGSKHQEFVPIDGTDEILVPAGIAHFLEHKLFETEDGVEPFKFYARNQANCNAFTSNHQTTYLFSGAPKINENINYLLDYVQAPYFTDENVFKEQGIIEQEIKMYEDNNYAVFGERLELNTFVKDPVGESVIGTVESVRSITKNDLYTCYNTFYHPSNMVMIVAGDVDPGEVISTIKSNQMKKDYIKSNPPKTKKYEEPDNVRVKDDIITKDIKIPLAGVSFKVRKSEFPANDRKALTMYLEIFTSSMNEKNIELLDKEIIQEEQGFYIIDSDTHFAICIFSESKKPEEYISFLKQEFPSLEIEEEIFTIIKRKMYARYVKRQDSAKSVNHHFLSSYIFMGEILDRAAEVENYTYEEFIKQIKSYNFSNNTSLIVK